MTGLIQVIAVFVGAMAAFGFNYILQMHRFNVQHKTEWMNKRVDAYVNLVGDIESYQTGVGDYSSIALHLAQAATFGSLTVKVKIAAYFQRYGFNFGVGSSDYLGLIAALIRSELFAIRPEYTFWQQYLWRLRQLPYSDEERKRRDYERDKKERMRIIQESRDRLPPID